MSNELVYGLLFFWLLPMRMSRSLLPQKMCLVNIVLLKKSLKRGLYGNGKNIRVISLIYFLIFHVLISINILFPLTMALQMADYLGK